MRASRPSRFTTFEIWPRTGPDCGRYKYAPRLQVINEGLPLNLGVRVAHQTHGPRRHRPAAWDKNEDSEGPPTKARKVTDDLTKPPRFTPSLAPLPEGEEPDMPPFGSSTIVEGFHQTPLKRSFQFTPSLPPLPEKVEQDASGHTWAPFLELTLPASGHHDVGDTARIVSWNLNGVRARLKKDKFLKVLAGADADVFCAQEFRWTVRSFLAKKEVTEAIRAMRYSHIVYQETASNPGYAGVVIFSRIPFLSFGEGVGDHELDQEGRVVWAEFQKFRLLNVYAPNSGSPGNLKSLPKKIKFQQRLNALLESFADKPVLMSGDFNVVRLDSDVWSGLSAPEWQNHPACVSQERDLLTSMLDNNHLIDVQASLGVQDFTFFRAKYLMPMNRGMRLDYFFCSAALMRLVASSEVHRSTNGSDHRAISLCLSRAAFPELSKEQGCDTPPFRVPGLAAAYARKPEFLDASMLAGMPCLENPAHYEHLLSDADQQEHNGTRPGQPWTHPLDRSRSGRVRLDDISRYLNGDEEEFLEADRTEYIDECCTLGHDEPIVPLVSLRLRGAKLPVEGLVDSGATACVADYRELCRVLTKHAVDSLLRTDTYTPQFRTADGGVTKPMGTLALEFSLGDADFCWDVYVIERGAYPIILGNDFLAAARTSILYAQQRIEFYSPAAGIYVEVPFSTKRGSKTTHHSAALLSEEDFVLPPFHMKRVDVQVDRASRFRPRREVFGHISPSHSDHSLAAVPGNDILRSGRTEIWVANLSSEHHLRVRPGARMAHFIEGDQDKFHEQYEIYPCDLAKFGKEDFFPDLRGLYPASVLSSEPSLPFVQPQPDSTALPLLATAQGAPHQGTGCTPSSLSPTDTDQHDTDDRSSRLPATGGGPSCASGASFPSPARRLVGGKGSLALPSGARIKIRRTIHTQKTPERVAWDREGAGVGRDTSPGLSAPSSLAARRLDKEAAPPSVLLSCSGDDGGGGKGASAETLARSAGRPNPRRDTAGVGDKFSPFSEDDVPLVHMPRFTKEQTDVMTEQEVLSHFSEGPLSRLGLGAGLSPQQLLALRLCLLQNRDMFALNDKSPGLVNKGGVRVDTGDAPPQVYPSRPVMPHVRPLIRKHIEEMLTYGIIEHSSSPWGAAVLMVPKKVTWA